MLEYLNSMSVEGTRVLFAEHCNTSEIGRRARVGVAFFMCVALIFDNQLTSIKKLLCSTWFCQQNLLENNVRAHLDLYY